MISPNLKSVTKPIRHVRHHAKKHHQSHETLKRLVNRPLLKERIWDIFISTFLITLTTLIIFLNWGNIVSFVSGGNSLHRGSQEDLNWVDGFNTGIRGSYRVDEQIGRQVKEIGRMLGSNGWELGIRTSRNLQAGLIQRNEQNNDTLKGSIQLTTDLSKGSHLTGLKKGQTLGLQKSLITTFYVGEKSITIDDTLALDTRLLQEINNTLRVDLFQYLNQATVRADALDNYLNLLQTLQEKAIARINDLNSKINFLSSNATSQENELQIQEEVFFQNLEMFNGPQAQKNLKEFIGIQKEQSETRAKLGAYQNLRDYYEVFLPRLENLTRAIRANRDALIAGVKVTEIQNMTLPLIIRE